MTAHSGNILCAGLGLGFILYCLGYAVAYFPTWLLRSLARRVRSTWNRIFRRSPYECYWRDRAFEAESKLRSATRPVPSTARNHHTKRVILAGIIQKL